MGDISLLESADIAAMTDLLCSAFKDDAAIRYIFRTPESRARWLRKLFVASARLTVGYGTATGIWTGDRSRLVAAALWFPPDRRFPPPWYRAIVHSYPLIPMMLEYRVCNRYQMLQKIGCSLVPKKRRVLLLSALAVEEEHRHLGLGSRLVKWGQSYAADHGSVVFLHCATELVPYYERLGFSPFSHVRLPAIADTYHGLLWEP